MPDEPKPPKRKDDVVFVHGPADDGEGYRVIRKRDDALELGELKTMKEGRPIHGEVVKLSPREGQPRLFDVEVLAEAPRAEARGKGPAQVATEAYRANWDAIFSPAPPPRRSGRGAPN